MEHAAWVNQLLDRVRETGEEGDTAMRYIRTHKTQIGFKRIRPSVGAMWTVFGNIRWNSSYYTYGTPMDNLRLKTLIIHEVRHLQRGIPTALSVYGQLDAWQLEFGIWYCIKGMYPHPSIAELMTFPPEQDHPVLQKAALLMQAYAGKGQRVDLLLLSPMIREVKYFLLQS